MRLLALLASLLLATSGCRHLPTATSPPIPAAEETCQGLREEAAPRAEKLRDRLATVGRRAQDRFERFTDSDLVVSVTTAVGVVGFFLGGGTTACAGPGALCSGG